jgi:hypothetical protein
MTTSGVDQTLYLISVTRQGTPVGIHTVAAPDALTAINLVEGYYSKPVRQERVLIEDESGSQYEATVASNWHGFMFQAQAIGPIAEQRAILPRKEKVVTAQVQV